MQILKTNTSGLKINIFNLVFTEHPYDYKDLIDGDSTFSVYTIVVLPNMTQLLETYCFYCKQNHKFSKVREVLKIGLTKDCSTTFPCKY